MWTLLTLSAASKLCQLSLWVNHQRDGHKKGLEVLTHRPRLKVTFLEAPLLPVKAIVRYVLLHHLVFGVKQHVTGCTRCSVLYVIHCKVSQNNASYINVSHKMFSKEVCKVILIVPTFIIGKLEVVIHGGYKLLHKETSNAGRQAILAFYLTLQHISVKIWEKQGGEIEQKSNLLSFFL